jgi:hypothetical protein
MMMMMMRLPFPFRWQTTGKKRGYKDKSGGRKYIKKHRGGDKRSNF